MLNYVMHDLLCMQTMDIINYVSLYRLCTTKYITIMYIYAQTDPHTCVVIYVHWMGYTMYLNKYVCVFIIYVCSPAL